jgi:hypothetical protein
MWYSMSSSKIVEVDGQWHYTFSGAGEVFSVVQPEMSKDIERKVWEEMMEILREERLI